MDDGVLVETIVHTVDVHRSSSTLILPRPDALYTTRYPSVLVLVDNKAYIILCHYYEHNGSIRTLHYDIYMYTRIVYIYIWYVLSRYCYNYSWNIIIMAL